MEKSNVRKIVVSSSAPVYGVPKEVLISEDAELVATNPYGRSKLMMEDIFKDLAISDNRGCISILRYFSIYCKQSNGNRNDYYWDFSLYT